MPRWFILTVAIATLALPVVEYFKPEPWTIGVLVGLVAVGGEYAIALADRRARKTGELTTLNLTGK
jgi:hypothetical protein